LTDEQNDERELQATVEQWLQALDGTSYYDLLGVVQGVNEAGIQAAFHEFSQSFHPDGYRHASAEIRQGVTTIFKRGAEAYRVLKDPTLRAAYDLALAQGALRYSRASGSRDSQGEKRGLEAICSSPGGRLHARQAERALSEGRLEEAKQLLTKAQTAEGINIALENKFRELFVVAQGIVPSD
jgi:DnaJ-class molecular chaperone